MALERHGNAFHYTPAGGSTLVGEILGTHTDSAAGSTTLAVRFSGDQVRGGGRAFTEPFNGPGGIRFPGRNATIDASFTFEPDGSLSTVTRKTVERGRAEHETGRFTSLLANLLLRKRIVWQETARFDAVPVHTTVIAIETSGNRTLAQARQEALAEVERAQADGRRVFLQAVGDTVSPLVEVASPAEAHDFITNHGYSRARRNLTRAMAQASQVAAAEFGGRIVLITDVTHTHAEWSRIAPQIPGHVATHVIPVGMTPQD
jgi:hypothetical protein